MIDRKRDRFPDFNSWHQFGILPYLDLKIWTIEEEVSISNRVIADAIFPDGEHGEETIRKTTEKLTKSIFKLDEIVEILGAQAYLEQSKQKI